MTVPAELASRQLNVLLDRYLEVCNHYSQQLREVEAGKDRPTRLTELIQSLEEIQPGDDAPIAIMQDGKARGQNIVPTKDTLDALAAYRDDILLRLQEPAQDLPRNIPRLTKWLKQDVREIVSTFPSFTLAWDKFVELSRLSAVPDVRQLLARDTVCMATIECERFLEQLTQLVQRTDDAKAGAAISAANPDPSKAAERLATLTTKLLEKIDSRSAKRISKITALVSSRGSHLDEVARAKALPKVIATAREDVDLLAIVGLELGFVHWLDLSAGAAHRKLVIKSLIYFSKILLAEAAWSRAVEFTDFAIALTREANSRAGLAADEGTAMFQCNRFWARSRLGQDIALDVRAWPTTELHPRYAFLQLVLLREHDKALEVLKKLVVKEANDESANMSIAEVEEWPILEEFRKSGSSAESVGRFRLR